MRLAARGYHGVLRVARTLADLDGADKIGRSHLARNLSSGSAPRDGCAAHVRCNHGGDGYAAVAPQRA